jgi:GNAT superfamily N-acetyltransferase
MHPHRKRYPNDVYWSLLRGIRERFFNQRHQFILVTTNHNGAERVISAADWRRLGKKGEQKDFSTIDPREYIILLFFLYIEKWQKTRDDIFG